MAETVASAPNDRVRYGNCFMIWRVVPVKDIYSLDVFSDKKIPDGINMADNPLIGQR